MTTLSGKFIFLHVRLESFRWIKTFLAFECIQLLFKFSHLTSVLQVLLPQCLHFLIKNAKQQKTEYINIVQ